MSKVATDGRRWADLLGTAKPLEFAHAQVGRGNQKGAISAIGRRAQKSEVIALLIEKYEAEHVLKTEEGCVVREEPLKN